MQHLEGSGTLILYIGRTVLKGSTFILLHGTIFHDKYIDYFKQLNIYKLFLCRL
jgi:hypothetical protein